MSEQKEITIRFRINACSESEISGGKGFVKTRGLVLVTWVW